jgi:hypothetical protein
MNRWAFLTVLVLVAGAVAALAIYTFGWRDQGDNERARAMLYAQEVARNAESECPEVDPKADCDYDDADVIEVEQVADRLWRSRMRLNPPGRVVCVAIDLEHFRVASNQETLHGMSVVDCPTE